MHVRLMSAVADAVGKADAGDAVCVSRLASELGISTKTFYKWAARYRAEGLDGLQERSRAPHRRPQRISPVIEDAIVELRKRLFDEGVDYGPDAIRWHLARGGTVRPPSEATIWRVLVRRGFIVPEPKKRPKRSIRRFEAAAPNECWQIDATEWTLADGTVVHIINVIDDHSRVLADSLAVPSATTEAAWMAFSRGVSRLGLPHRCLSDNGLAFSGRIRGVEVYFETQLRALGVQPVVSRPYHPQTCGKVERFQQTLKKWLRRRGRQLASVADLQAALDEFRHYYNHQRPHRGIGRAIPWERFTASPPAAPPTAALPGPPKTLHGRVLDTGNLPLGELIINLGTEHAGQPATALIHGDHAAVFIHGRLVRALQLDRSRVYQPSGKPKGGPRRRPH